MFINVQDFNTICYFIKSMENGIIPTKNDFIQINQIKNKVIQKYNESKKQTYENIKEKRKINKNYAR